MGTHKTGPSWRSPKPARSLVIVDEAHRGLQNENSEAFQGVSAAAAGAKTLLVTATPYQLTTTGFTRMLGVSSGAAAPPDADLCVGIHLHPTIALCGGGREQLTDPVGREREVGGLRELGHA